MIQGSDDEKVYYKSNVNEYNEIYKQKQGEKIQINDFSRHQINPMKLSPLTSDIKYHEYNSIKENTKRYYNRANDVKAYIFRRLSELSAAIKEVSDKNSKFIDFQLSSDEINLLNNDELSNIDDQTSITAENIEKLKKINKANQDQMNEMESNEVNTDYENVHSKQLRVIRYINNLEKNLYNLNSENKK